MGEQRGPWYLLTGLAIGLALGLVYAWWINPVAYVNTAPASLRPDSKEAYRSLIAAAFGANGNLERARVRLSLLKDRRVDRRKTPAAWPCWRLLWRNHRQVSRESHLLPRQPLQPFPPRP
jgi:hypothetical protein